MLIEVDLKEAKRLKITVNQFILITLLIGKYDIKSLLDVIPISETDISNLIKRDILTKESIFDPKDFSKLIINSEFLQDNKPRDFFAEFFELYPSVAKRPDGIKQYLRLNPTRCRKYYLDIVGKDTKKHEHMMNCLKFEISTRMKSGNLQYMKTMPKWFSTEEWFVYEEYLKDTKNIEKAEIAYGTDVE